MDYDCHLFINLAFHFNTNITLLIKKRQKNANKLVGSYECDFSETVGNMWKISGDFALTSSKMTSKQDPRE